jgi:hypothetical protein
MVQRVVLKSLEKPTALEKDYNNIKRRKTIMDIKRANRTKNNILS